MPTNLENSAVATGLEKVSFHSNPQKGNAKECSNYCTIALILHASNIMLKILQARLQQYVILELPDVQASFRKGRDFCAQKYLPFRCEVKWALRSITMNKASGGDGIPVELFKILKDNAVKVLLSVCQQI